MNLKYVQNYFSDDTLEDYTMTLKAPIGECYLNGISGQQFAEEFDFIASLPEVKRIHLRICSPGGSVTEGMAIITSILNCEKEVITYADGFVASIASLIFISGTTTKMWDAGLLMFHGVSGGDPATHDIWNDSLSLIYQKRLNKSEAEVTEWMSKDTYFKAEDAKKAGIVDEIYNTPSKTKYIEKEEITVENVNTLFITSVANLATELVETPTESANDEVENAKINNEDMELIKLIEVLNLAPESTSEEVINHVETVKNALVEVENLTTIKAELETTVENMLTEVTNLKNDLLVKDEAITVLNTAVTEKTLEVTNLSDKVTAFEAEDAKRHTAKINDLINGAIEANRIQAGVKNEWIEMATENYDRTERILNAIRPAKMKLNDVVEVENKGGAGQLSFATEMAKIAEKANKKSK